MRIEEAEDAEDATSRRGFLKATGLGLSALVLGLKAARQSFAEEVEGLGAATPDFAGLSSHYSLGDGVSYLNHASIGTIAKPVQASHRRYLELCESNPWLHMWGEAWKEPLESVRAQAAAFIGCEPQDVSFSHNTTEVFNLLAHGLPLGEGDEVLFSSLNHSGASVCWSHVGEQRGFTVRRFDFPVMDAASMSEADVVACHLEAIRPETKVLALPHVDNLLGIRHPLRALADGARDRGVEFIVVDAAQSVGMLPLDVGALGVDAYATSAHKWIQGPKGLGVAYLRPDLQERLRPMWVTWGQRLWTDSVRRFEDYGTRNLAEVLALGDAMTFQDQLGAERVESHHRRLHAAARTRVDAEPSLTWQSPATWELGSAIYSIGVDGRPSSELFRELFETHGLVFRPFEVQGLNAVRFSPNTLNTESELMLAFDRLVPALAA